MYRIQCVEYNAERQIANTDRQSQKCQIYRNILVFCLFSAHRVIGQIQERRKHIDAKGWNMINNGYCKRNMSKEDLFLEIIKLLLSAANIEGLLV